MTTRQQWAEALIRAGGFADTQANRDAIVAWEMAEGSHAAWNPLDTTLPRPGAWPYNTFHVGSGATLHVWNYHDEADGLEATLATLRNGRYTHILTALEHGSDADEIARAVGASPWGTRGDTMAHLLGAIQADRQHYYRLALPNDPGHGGDVAPPTRLPDEEDQVLYQEPYNDAAIRCKVRELYRSYLLRPATDDEVNGWQAEWHAHGPEAVVEGIIASSEDVTVARGERKDATT